MSLIFITFIFKLATGTYYGKFYTDAIAPDHEGLDEIIRPYLRRGLPEGEKVQIGILSISNLDHIAIHSSNEEKDCFDFYGLKYTINYSVCEKIYLFGQLLPIDGN
jgi:hypothetical protein